MKNKGLVSSLLILVFSLGITSASNAQILISLLLGDKLNDGNIEFGLTGGLNQTYLSGLDQSKGMGHFNMGFYFDIKLKDKLFAHTGVLVVSSMGAKDIPVYSLNNPNLDSIFQGGSVRRKIEYFNVPIELKYRFNKFFIDAGCMLALRHKSNDVFYQEVKEKDDLTYTLDIRDQIHRIDAGAIAGLGYKLKSEGPAMSFGVKYYYGLTDIFKDERKSNNTSLYFYVHVPIGAGKNKD